MKRISCEHLHGRLRAICEGVDAGGNPIDMTPEKRLEYLRSLFPGEEEETLIAHVTLPRESERFGLGDLVAAGIKLATFGKVEPCGSCNKRKDWLNSLLSVPRKPKGNTSGGSPFRMANAPVRFIKSAQLQQDILNLIGQIPSDITAIAGVARSGLSVATMISMYLHLPLIAIRQSKHDIIETGNGWRLGGNRHVDRKAGRILVIDDTVMTGNSIKAIRPLVQEQLGDHLFAAVYVNPAAHVKPDIWAVDLPWPHILEWNIFNSILSPSIAVDFDGILCHDCPPGSDDDGPKYLDFIRNAKPLYVPRRTPIPLIVTARIERYRAETQAWLDRHRIKFKKLIMHPANTLHERNRDDIPAYKASHFKEWCHKPWSAIKPYIFFESEDWQARRIGQLASGKDRVVICPATAGVY